MYNITYILKEPWRFSFGRLDIYSKSKNNYHDFRGVIIERRLTLGKKRDRNTHFWEPHITRFQYQNNLQWMHYYLHFYYWRHSFKVVVNPGLTVLNTWFPKFKGAHEVKVIFLKILICYFPFTRYWYLHPGIKAIVGVSAAPLSQISGTKLHW